jgi:hypothetical protein
MGRLVRHEERKARYARVDLESGEPVWISVAQAGVIVRQSRLGLIGRKIYSESRLGSVVAHCRHLDALKLRPADGVLDPVLAPFTAAAVSARTLRALHALLSVPPLIESSYMAASEFAVLQSFANDYSAFLERASKWNFGYSEALLPLPAETIGEMLLVFARAVRARRALNLDVRFAIRFGYGQLALALPSAQGDEAAAIGERLIAGDLTVEQDTAWDRVRGRVAGMFEAQTARELHFDRELPEEV